MTEGKKKEIFRGEIYWFHSGGELSSEQSGNRPCVVVSNNMANHYSPVVTVVPITSRSKKRLPTHASLKTLLFPSIALCEQVRSVSKDRLSSYIGTCTPSEMVEIDKGLCVQLCLPSMTNLLDNMELGRMVK
ncbi:MAG: type II toxin-antitoxin system PemK/MazF family toxin [Clostridia bacterium]|nr:type II toxin-antitoxin system PemK/MazF family toxin [Clostridia bacterium]